MFSQTPCHHKLPIIHLPSNLLYLLNSVLRMGSPTTCHLLVSFLFSTLFLLLVKLCFDLFFQEINLSSSKPIFFPVSTPDAQTHIIHIGMHLKLEPSFIIKFVYFNILKFLPTSTIDPFFSYSYLNVERMHIFISNSPTIYSKGKLGLTQGYLRLFQAYSHSKNTKLNHSETGPSNRYITTCFRNRITVSLLSSYSSFSLPSVSLSSSSLTGFLVADQNLDFTIFPFSLIVDKRFIVRSINTFIFHLIFFYFKTKLIYGHLGRRVSVLILSVTDSQRRLVLKPKLSLKIFFFFTEKGARQDFFTPQLNPLWTFPQSCQEHQEAQDSNDSMALWLSVIQFNIKIAGVHPTIIFPYLNSLLFPLFHLKVLTVLFVISSFCFLSSFLSFLIFLSSDSKKPLHIFFFLVLVFLKSIISLIVGQVMYLGSICASIPVQVTTEVFRADRDSESCEELLLNNPWESRALNIFQNQSWDVVCCQWDDPGSVREHQWIISYSFISRSVIELIKFLFIKLKQFVGILNCCELKHHHESNLFFSFLTHLVFYIWPVFFFCTLPGLIMNILLFFSQPNFSQLVLSLYNQSRYKQLDHWFSFTLFRNPLSQSVTNSFLFFFIFLRKITNKNTNHVVVFHLLYNSLRTWQSYCEQMSKMSQLGIERRTCQGWMDLFLKKGWNIGEVQLLVLGKVVEGNNYVRRKTSGRWEVGRARDPEDWMRKIVVELSGIKEFPRLETSTRNTCIVLYQWTSCCGEACLKQNMTSKDPLGSSPAAKYLTLQYKRWSFPHQIQPFHTKSDEPVLIYQVGALVVVSKLSVHQGKIPGTSREVP
ncbi:hypothetical protein VP01_1451g2 [Puccinia sorghi]|uniref:Uncharacterized protein n=1 Tax=Puccinia sorghi TaxID=27349 RepID=A0A0L6VK03_9BASI|nr:hypothetical protein VP01_1451g2 [Puccinia sorghi]